MFGSNNYCVIGNVELLLVFGVKMIFQTSTYSLSITVSNMAAMLQNKF